MKRSVFAAALAVLAAPAIARAHAGLPLTQDHRLVTLTIADEEITIADVVALSGASAGELRQRFDADHDGKISASEQEAIGVEIAARVVAGLGLALDGHDERVHAEVTEVRLEGDAVGPDPLTVTAVVRAYATGDGQHQLALKERTSLPRPGELHVTVLTTGRARLLRAPANGEPKDGGVDYAFRLDAPCQRAPDCGVTVGFVGGVARTRGTKPLFLVAIAIALCSGAGYLWRRVTRAPKRA